MDERSTEEQDRDRYGCRPQHWRTIAQVFADEGANVVIADIDTEGGRETVQQIRHQGGSAEFVPADVSDACSTVSLVDSTVSLFGKLDIIVNNAVRLPDPEVGTLELSEGEWDRTLVVSLKSVFLMAKASIPVMRRAKAGGAIVNISSVNAIVTNPWYQAYRCCKGRNARVDS